ncbi:MAG: glycoside hydrolase family 9 protein [Leadbetterella sp.]
MKNHFFKKHISSLFFIVLIASNSFAQLTKEQNYIRLDQFGYPPNAPKYAIIAKAEEGFNVGRGIELTATNKIEIISTKTSKAVFQGTAKAWANGTKDNYSGDKGWWFDFTSFTEPGEYFLKVYKPDGSSVDSYKFIISDDVYAEALRAAVNMFYYQRTNIKKTGEFAAGAKWTDDAWYDRGDQDTKATFIHDASKTKDVSKGWIDAGDPNKYVTFAVDPVHDLLTTYEQQKPMWDVFNLKIPESNNNIPDLLDEIKWEIDWIKNMQDDASGGLHMKAGILNDSRYISPPSIDTRRRYYNDICPSSSIIGSGMMAHAAIHFKKFSELSSYASDLQIRAEKAWDYYEASGQKDAKCDGGEIEAGDADGPGDHYATEHKAEAAATAVYLYALTGKEKYHTFFKNNFKETRPWKSSDWGVYRGSQSSALLFYLTLLNTDAATRNEIIAKKSAADKSSGSNYEVVEADNLYRAKSIYANWGSNSLLGRQGNDNMDFINYKLLPNNHPKYRERALSIINYFHGVNPFGMCYVSNMYQFGADFCYDEMWHTWFNTNSKYDNINNGNVGPAPGYIAGGFNKSTTTDMLVKIGTEEFPFKVSAQPIQKAFSVDNTASSALGPWAYNEPAIYYNSGYVKLLANFVASNAKPVAVESIKLLSTKTSVEVDEELLLSSIIVPSIATNPNVTWSSSDSKIATVNANGLVTGIKEGTVQIKATTADGGKTDQVTITVTPLPTPTKCGFIENDGFESNLKNWINLKNASLISSSSKNGKKAVLISGEGGVEYISSIPITSDKAVEVKFWGRTEENPYSASVYVNFLNEKNEELKREEIKVNSTDYKQYVFAQKGPTNAKFVRFFAYKSGSLGKFYIDDFCLNLTTLLGAEPRHNEKLQVFPNPTTGKLDLIIPFEKSSNVNLEVISVDGRSMLQSNFKLKTSNGKHTVLLKSLPAGIYMLRVSDGIDFHSERVILE